MWRYLPCLQELNFPVRDCPHWNRDWRISVFRSCLLSRLDSYGYLHWSGFYSCWRGYFMYLLSESQNPCCYHQSSKYYYNWSSLLAYAKELFNFNCYDVWYYNDDQYYINMDLIFNRLEEEIYGSIDNQTSYTDAVNNFWNIYYPECLFMESQIDNLLLNLNQAIIDYLNTHDNEITKEEILNLYDIYFKSLFSYNLSCYEKCIDNRKYDFLDILIYTKSTGSSSSRSAEDCIFILDPDLISNMLFLFKERLLKICFNCCQYKWLGYHFIIESIKEQCSDYISECIQYTQEDRVIGTRRCDNLILDYLVFQSNYDEGLLEDKYFKLALYGMLLSNRWGYYYGYWWSSNYGYLKFNIGLNECRDIAGLPFYFECLLTFNRRCDDTCNGIQLDTITQIEDCMQNIDIDTLIDFYKSLSLSPRYCGCDQDYTFLSCGNNKYIIMGKGNCADIATGVQNTYITVNNDPFIITIKYIPMNFIYRFIDDLTQNCTIDLCSNWNYLWSIATQYCYDDYSDWVYKDLSFRYSFCNPDNWWLMILINIEYGSPTIGHGKSNNIYEIQI